MRVNLYGPEYAFGDAAALESVLWQAAIENAWEQTISHGPVVDG